MMSKSGFTSGLVVGGMIGLGISMANVDNVKRIRKSWIRTAKRMKLNRVMNNITENFVDMF